MAERFSLGQLLGMLSAPRQSTPATAPNPLRPMGTLGELMSEMQFRDWYQGAAKKFDLSPNPDGQFYDYRAARRANAWPDESGHWPSQFKQPGHPNMVVGGFHVQTGQRVPGTPRAKTWQELVSLGWDENAAHELMKAPEPR